jgi:peptidoglycan hydrolase-like protein with peptidoglycan-binding domain
MKTKTIESLQQWLKEKGFNPGPIDGENGPKTFKAWSDYIGQAANGASNTIESLQRWLKEKGFNPGPIDGADGPKTFAAWSAYIGQAATGASNPSKDLASGQDALKRLLARAKADVGKLSTRNDRGTDNGNLGCADAVTRILHDELGFSIQSTFSTYGLKNELVAAGWQTVDLSTTGAVIVSPSRGDIHGHTGIVGENGVIYSNRSATGLWDQNYTVDSWEKRFERLGSYAFVPPAQAAPRVETEQRPVGFAPLGDKAPIKGQFSITSPQMRSLCRGTFAPYGLYADAIVEESAKYGINPLFVLADLVNQGVKPEYRNPWGISKDNYPYGPGGTQLGQPNGHVRNGPRKFSEDEWRNAFNRQFQVVASGRAYSNARTIAEWAKIDAPAGAENDVHGTNAQEGTDVGGIYNRLVAMLA